MKTKPCNGCGQDIHFIQTTAGKWMPCEVEEIWGNELPDGHDTLVTEEGNVLKAPPDTERGYEPHWKYCTQSDNFRRK